MDFIRYGSVGRFELECVSKHIGYYQLKHLASAMSVSSLVSNRFCAVGYQWCLLTSAYHEDLKQNDYDRYSASNSRWCHRYHVVYPPHRSPDIRFPGFCSSFMLRSIIIILKSILLKSSGISQIKACLII